MKKGAKRKRVLAAAKPAARPKAPKRAKRVPRDVWVFGYGSLMWDPGFAPAEVQRATLRGYRRALCIYSRFHRGTLERPGLVLGLDRGGSCRGMAFRIAGAEARRVIGYLDERELVSYAYRRCKVVIRLAKRQVPAFAYVADRKHSQYAGDLGITRSVEMVAQGVGVSGTCFDYLENTVKHLEALGIEDAPLKTLLGLVIEKFRRNMSFEV